MATKRKPTKKIGERRKKILSESEKNDATSPKQESNEGVEGKPLDYGGIPDRDLKKNLGCG